MSKTYCRFCDIVVLGLYVNCPRCGEYLPPVGEGSKTPPEPFQLVKLGDSWKTALPQPSVGNNDTKAAESLGQLPGAPTGGTEAVDAS